MVPTESELPADPTSAAWIRNVVAGKGGEQDWQALFDRYRQALTIYATRQLGPHLLRQHAPEDLVQSAWTEICGQIERFQYRGKGSLRTWLRIKIRREATRLGQRGAREESRQPADPGRDDNVLATVEGREMHERILAALDKLPLTYRRVVEARFIDGHRVVAIARSLGLKPDTVSQQLRRGLALWRQELGETPASTSACTIECDAPSTCAKYSARRIGARRRSRGCWGSGSRTAR